MENETFATEMLRELKTSNRRWFVSFLIVLTLWFATIGAFLWYISLPMEDISISQKADGNSNLVSIGDMYGGKSNNKIQETSKKEP